MSPAARGWVALLWVGSASLGAASDDRIAAYGRVSPGEGVLTIAIPYYLGAPQTVRELLVKEGDRVNRGQKLAVTEAQPLAAADLVIANAHLAAAEQRLKALSAGPRAEEVAAQEATIKSLEADARAEKARKRPDGAAEQAQAAARLEALLARVEAAQHQLAALREIRPSDLAVAQAEAAEAKAAAGRAEILLASTEVEAPSDGQVLQILTRAGEGNRGLLELADTRAMLIKAELNVADARAVKAGARAAIRSDAWQGEINGTVLRVSPRVTRSGLTALSTFANVDRQIVEATIQPETPEKLAVASGAEVTVLIAPGPR